MTYRSYRTGLPGMNAARGVNRMRLLRSSSTLVFAVGLMAGPAAAQQLYIFPEKGQSEKQQQEDRGACHGWAVGQTGFDPGLTGPSAQAQTRSTTGGMLKGGAFGALGGAAIGAIAGNAGKGAAIGAIGGGLFNGLRRRDQNSQAQAQSDAYNRQQDAMRREYRRALSACLEGKGYTVK